MSHMSTLHYRHRLLLYTETSGGQLKGRVQSYVPRDPCQQVATTGFGRWCPIEAEYRGYITLLIETLSATT